MMKIEILGDSWGFLGILGDSWGFFGILWGFFRNFQEFYDKKLILVGFVRIL